MARELEIGQIQNALNLKNAQDHEAAELLRENLEDAGDLEAIGADEMSILAVTETKRTLYQQELEQIILWSLGSYSGSGPVTAEESAGVYDMMISDRLATAEKLKEHQTAAAKRLEETQARTTLNLAETQRAEAERLKENQHLTAIELVEKNIIKILHKRIEAENDRKRL